MSHLVRNLVYSKVIGKTRSASGPPCSAMVRKHILAAFADRANDDGSDAYVSKMRISAELECNRETVVIGARSLVADGLMRETGKRPGRQGYTVIYRVMIEALQALPDAWGKCRNSDTLDDELVEGEEPIGRALGGAKSRARRAVDKTVKVSGSPTESLSESGLQSVGVADMNCPSKTEIGAGARAPEDARPRFDGRRAAGDAEYGREAAEARRGRPSREATPERRYVARAVSPDEKELAELECEIADIRAGRTWNFATEDVKALRITAIERRLPDLRQKIQQARRVG